MIPHVTQALLVRLHGGAAAGALLDAALDRSVAYVYGWFEDGAAPASASVWALRDALTALLGAAFTLDRLDLVRDFAGASAGAPAPFFYAVETNPAEGSETEMFDWYDSEHMPGLAAVPGCVRALRLINRDGGPRSHACYALCDSDVTSTPQWLAVRATEWSARVRPNFRDTRRTMFRAL